MKQKSLLENSTLTNIVNSVNLGLLGIEDPETILIFSDEKPGILIKLIAVEIPDHVLEILSHPAFDQYKDQGLKIETTLIDFVVFTVVEEPDDESEFDNAVCKTLINMSLTEYMCSASSFDESESVDKHIWNLIEIIEDDDDKSQEKVDSNNFKLKLHQNENGELESNI